MCKPVEIPHVVPGWGCCRCRCYNGAWRDECKNCGHANCLDVVTVARLRAAERRVYEDAGVPVPSSQKVRP